MREFFRYFPHVVVFLLLSTAEGFRLFDFYNVMTGSEIAGIASAVVSVGIVFYLAFYGYSWASKWATFLCIVLSLASFVKPVQTEYKADELRNPTKELKEYPKYDYRMSWSLGKEIYAEMYKKERQNIDDQNIDIMNENQAIRAEKKLSLYFYHLLLGALVLGVCVPILNYLVSHKISQLRNWKGVDLRSGPLRKIFPDETDLFHTKDNQKEPPGPGDPPAERAAAFTKEEAEKRIQELSTVISSASSQTEESDDDFFVETPRPKKSKAKKKIVDLGPGLPFPFFEWEPQFA
jgi:hypothetical protein